MPLFEELPIREGLPPESAWGVFGDQDDLGTLNWLTPAGVIEAARLVQTGRVFRIDEPIGYAHPPLFERSPMRHSRISNGPFRNDDVLDNYNTQEGSQWDGLAHMGMEKYARYYNNVRDDQIGPASSEKRLSIHRWANRMIGRAVLLDVFSAREEQGNPVDPLAAEEYSVEDLEVAIRLQACKIYPGSVVLMRTGWMAAYQEAEPHIKASMANRRTLTSCGLEPTREAASWLWDNRVSAVAFDCPAAEPWPWDMERGTLHYRALTLLGLPLGEQFNFEELVANCREDDRWEGMFVSIPLHLVGGIATPANAVVIK